MSNLRKTLRALDGESPWREILTVAFQYCEIEPTRKQMIDVTLALVDGISFNENTLEIDVSGVSDEAVLEQVQALCPCNDPEPEPEPTSEVESGDVEVSDDSDA